jgi:hypothetical protein
LCSIASYGSTSLSTRREKPPPIINHSNHKDNDDDEIPNGDYESKIFFSLFDV